MPEREHDGDWASRLTAGVDQFTRAVKDHSLRPLSRAVRMIGLVVVTGLLGVAAIILSLIGLVRLLDHDLFAGRAWASDLSIGGMFGLLGMFLLQRAAKVRN